MFRVALTTLGCKANWADTEALAQALAGAGLAAVPWGDAAEACVVNTCTVTAIADAQSRQLLRRARRAAPKAVIVATGCLGETSAEALRALPEVDAVFGTSDRAALVAFLCERAGRREGGTRSKDPFGLLATRPQSRARAFLKIQEGCDRRCTYCIVPAARGGSRSLPVEHVLRACTELADHHREIILAGIDIGQYGGDLAPLRGLPDLLEELAAARLPARLRLSSLSPRLVDARLVRLLASGAFCRHVHLSIQSGSDAVLARMRRGYDAAAVARAAALLAEGVPGIAVTGDVIAGFPGETEEEHEATKSLFASLPLAGLHVFPFSPRPGTAAAAMPDQVPHAVRKRRAAELRALALQKRRSFLQGLIGERVDVIVTSRAPGEDGRVEAVADLGIEIRLPAGGCGYAKMGAAIVTGVEVSEVRGQWA